MQKKVSFLLLALPGLTWLSLLLVIPCALIFAYSFMMRGTYGGVIYTFTLQNFSLAADPLYLRIIVTSFRISIIATFVALLVGYPAAYAITRLRRNLQVMVMILVILPFWSNYLIRMYAWIVLLNQQGIVNTALLKSGLISEPLQLLYNEGAVIVGLVHSYLPFVVLTIYSSLQRLNPELAEASRDLGANAAQTFWRVTLPLTLPGVASGGVFVFVLSVGNFLTPNLLGGGQVRMIGNVIYDQFTVARDWPFGSALAMLLIFIMLALLFAQAILANRGARQAS